MASIFDQYKSVNKGILSESQFLRNVKMALPKFISNMTTFDDAVKILKNKGIITEAKLNEMTLENWTEEIGDEINDAVIDGRLTQEEANEAHDYLEDNYYDMGMSGEFSDPLYALNYILKQNHIDKELNEAKAVNPMYQYDPQQYDLGMRYELDKGTDEEKAHKLVCKNLEKRASYYTDLFLAGYDESAMKMYDNRDGADLDTEVKKDNFLDTKNQMKKVKMDKLTEDELKVLIGNILAESADQKKTNLTESIEDNIAQIVNDKSSKYTFYNPKHKADMQKIFRMSAIRQILKNPNLTDEDKQKLEAELAANKPEPVKSTTSAGPGSVELYRLGQKGNYTGD
jgi:hypothetical protein